MPVMVADPSDHASEDARRETAGKHEDAAALACLMDQAVRALRNLCFASDLHPVQWAALRFLAAAEPSHRTLKALALHHGTTPAPVSRTIAVLIRKGYLRATVDPRDRRSRRLDVTEAGAAQLARDPLLRLQAVLQDSSPEERRALRRVLERAISELGGVPGSLADEAPRHEVAARDDDMSGRTSRSTRSRGGSVTDAGQRHRAAPLPRPQ